jgi:uncharacterized protein YndB with AHSA1/START domain
MNAIETNPTQDLAQSELVLTRLYNAPRDLVFAAWTNPKHLAQWWGPYGFTNPVCEIDVRPGGAIRIHMRGPDGVVYPMTGTFEDITEPERLVFASAALDGKGEPLFETWNIVTLEKFGEKTALTLRARVLRIAPGAPGKLAVHYLAGMEAGWTQSLERLGDLVDKK